jgi:hypothetical protein
MSQYSLEDIYLFDEPAISQFLTEQGYASGDNPLVDKVNVSMLLYNSNQIVESDKTYVADKDFAEIAILPDQDLLNRLLSLNINQPVNRPEAVKIILDNARTRRPASPVAPIVVGSPTTPRSASPRLSPRSLSRPVSPVAPIVVGRPTTPRSASPRLSPRSLSRPVSPVAPIVIGSPSSPRITRVYPVVVGRPISPRPTSRVSPVVTGVSGQQVVLSQIPPMTASFMQTAAPVVISPQMQSGPIQVAALPKKNPGGLGYYLIGDNLYLCGGKAKKYGTLLGSVPGAQKQGNCWIFPSSQMASVTPKYQSIYQGTAVVSPRGRPAAPTAVVGGMSVITPRGRGRPPGATTPTKLPQYVLPAAVLQKIPGRIEGSIGKFSFTEVPGYVFLIGTAVIHNKKMVRNIPGAMESITSSGKSKGYVFPSSSAAMVLAAYDQILAKESQKAAVKKTKQYIQPAQSLITQSVSAEPRDTDPNMDLNYLRAKWDSKISVIAGTVNSNQTSKAAQMTYQGDIRPPDLAFAYALNGWQAGITQGSVTHLSYKLFNVTVAA